MKNQRLTETEKTDLHAYLQKNYISEQSLSRTNVSYSIIESKPKVSISDEALLPSLRTIKKDKKNINASSSQTRNGSPSLMQHKADGQTKGSASSSSKDRFMHNSMPSAYSKTNFSASQYSKSLYPDLDKQVKLLEESFSERLLRLIDQKNMTDADCYKKANIDRKHFSKIRCSKDYKPKKNTVLAFAIALQLNICETNDFLKRAGYSFSSSILSDVIVKYFIIKKDFDIFKINEALYHYNQPLLGTIQN